MNKTLMLGSISLALALSGCGYLPGGGSSSAASTTTADPADQAVKFAQCMRSHGVQMADPVNGNMTIKANSKDHAKVDAAMKACQKYSPAATGKRPPGADSLDAALKLARCLRAHGLDVPEPTAGGPMGVMKPRNKTDAEVQKAMEACSPGMKTSTDNGGPATRNG